MSIDFLSDLDEYFCKKYSNQTKLAAIKGFKQPIVTQENELDISPEQYKLCYQDKAKELLATFKDGLIDKDFSFSFADVPFFEGVKRMRRKDTFSKILPSAFKKYSLDLNLFYHDLAVSESIWKAIVKGKYDPTKNLIFAIAIVGGMSERDTAVLLDSCGYEFDYENVRDTVVSYLLSYGIYNMGLVSLALNEYKITCLPLKQD